MLKRTLAMLLSALTLTAILCGCGIKKAENTLKNEYYNYEFSEYITVKSIDIKIKRNELDNELLKAYRAAAKKDAKSTVYGGTAEGALPADGITVENGDTANIDYVGTLNGVAFAGGTASGSDLEIGSNSFIDGFESGLVGATVGETRALNLTFPESYHSADLAGKSVVFTVTVNYIKRPIYPEYNEENFKKYVGSTIAEAEKELKGSMVFDRLYTDTEVKKYPEKEISNIVSKYVNGYTQQAQQYGMTLEAYVTAIGMTMDMFNSQIEELAKQYVKRDLITFYLVDRLPQLQVNDSDYEAQAKALFDKLKESGEYSGTYEDFTKYNDKFDILTNIYTTRIVEYFGNNAEIVTE